MTSDTRKLPVASAAWHLAAVYDDARLRHALMMVGCTEHALDCVRRQLPDEAYDWARLAGSYAEMLIEQHGGTP